MIPTGFELCGSLRLRNAYGAFAVGIRQDNRKLFAAEACHQVSGPHDHVLGHFCNLLEATVALHVSISSWAAKPALR